ncbi:hypothetical protein H8S44_04010 [Anaerosacchariphilus sp. NSJ-68]|uniref:Uncharacterized protein n=2 Tax=Lachnospiraceae TaxID=186803 RepID=A0A923LB26_9FIRM|nr:MULTISPECIES: hypothetical protein [Lachnospiraceae]MBC5658934.1 hypothetical protein [Anaerosacchariphilus hominis]MBC5698797.1 hypothetical protein [Roseburia difficilis]
MKKQRNPLGQFVIGMVMLAAGLYWFMSNVTVMTHFGFQIWNFRIGAGLIVVPFIAGIIWLFLNVDSFGAKLLTVLGLVIILASIISNIQFMFRATSMYVYLIMLILIFGGAALVGQVLFRWPKDEDRDKKKK